MTSSAKSNDASLAADGGLQSPPVSTDEPFHALDDLMAVVEALSPRWPERDHFVTAGKMKL